MNRFSKIAKRLPAFGLDALLVTNEANRLYASGVRAYKDDGILLITRDKNYYFTDSRCLEAVQNQIEDAAVSMPEPGKGFIWLINEAIDEHCIRQMGFEDARMAVSEYEILRKGLRCELLPASRLLAGLRKYKDADELRLLAGSQRIAEKAYEEVLRIIKPGMSEIDIAVWLGHFMLLSGAEAMAFPPSILSGPNTSMPHGAPSGRKVAYGDVITMDFGCVYEGYCSDMTRTVALGRADADFCSLYSTVLEAQLAGISAAKAGVTGRFIDGAARKVIEKAGHGDFFGHSFGHGIGIEVHEEPVVGPFSDDLPISVGAVMTAEPGIYIPNKYGVRIEDMIVIQENGCDRLTSAERDLIILP